MDRGPGTGKRAIPRLSAFLMMRAAWGFVAGPAGGQSAAPAPPPGSVRAESQEAIPPPRRFGSTDPAVRRIRLATASIPGWQDPTAARARLDDRDSVLAYDRAQFRLKRAIGEPP